VINLHDQGLSLDTSLQIVLDDIQKDKHLQKIFLLFMVIKFGVFNGCNLVQILDSFQKQLKLSEKLKNKIQSATASMRFQAYILSSLPVFMVFCLLICDPRRIFFFFESARGFILFLLVILWNALGWYHMSSIIKKVAL